VSRVTEADALAMVVAGTGASRSIVQMVLTSVTVNTSLLVPVLKLALHEGVFPAVIARDPSDDGYAMEYTPGSSAVRRVRKV
jgi:hypothetical protein